MQIASYLPKKLKSKPNILLVCTSACTKAEQVTKSIGQKKNINCVLVLFNREPCLPTANKSIKCQKPFHAKPARKPLNEHQRRNLCQTVRDEQCSHKILFPTLLKGFIFK